jgi:hypothetical protein
MKRTVIFILLAALLLSCFAACDKSEPAPDVGGEQSSAPDVGGEQSSAPNGGETQSPAPVRRDAPGDWRPDVTLETDEYTYGIENLSVTPADDGKFKISFRLGAFFNYDIMDFDMDAQNPAFVTPVVSLSEDFSKTLDERTWISSGNYYREPVFVDCEYTADAEPEKLYIKTPTMYIAPRSETLEIGSGDISGYECEVTVLERVTDGRYPATPVRFTFALPGKLEYPWYSSFILADGEEVEGGRPNSLTADSVTYEFYLPDGVTIDSGYTLRFSTPRKPLEPVIFELDV